MNKKSLMAVRDGEVTRYFKGLERPRADGVCAVGVGYRKNGRDHWY